MDLIFLLLGIAVIGFIAWVITQIPMPPVFKTIIWVICAIVLILFLARQFGSHVPNVMP